jgi:hypothetical protein
MQRVCVYIYIYDCTHPDPHDEQISSFPQVPRSPGPNGWSVIRKLVQKPAGYFLKRTGSLCPPKKKGGVESLEILHNMHVNHWKYSTILLVELFQWFIANLKYSSNMYVKCTLYSIYSRHDDCNNSEVFNHSSPDQQANMLDTPLGDSQLAALGWYWFVWNRVPSNPIAIWGYTVYTIIHHRKTQPEKSHHSSNDERSDGMGSQSDAPCTTHADPNNSP